MAYGPVSVSGVSKKAMERLMYMDGKLVWSAAMGTSGGLSVTAPDEVDYIIVKPKSCDYKDVKIARGCAGNIPWYQGEISSSSSSYPHTYRYGKVTFAADGKITISYSYAFYDDYLTVEGYQYV